MTVKPLSDRVLLRRIEADEQVKGGIIIPDTAKEKPLEAEVIAVGPGKPDKTGNPVPVDVEIGNRVLIGQYAGTEVEVDGDEYVIASEDDILGILS
ncbi:MAG TPA: co-chaperone GroES [Candidatus Latescibacteria bacterium]|nr:co-chaperone GroES [Gemmatimonadota bacterium]HCR19639.1 co-chaperone GroES [Candidatus Latescibacterota bacterium]|tara:strand:+ start:823 stop:1110 length:288 start_codon:yes stop_codon:yes gene_type:complete